MDKSTIIKPKIEVPEIEPPEKKEVKVEKPKKEKPVKIPSLGRIFFWGIVIGILIALPLGMYLGHNKATNQFMYGFSRMKIENFNFGMPCLCGFQNISGNHWF